ncbi:UNVERIFIED_CONTAM: hypothetical protein K2H54_013902, partial [Gekko kuhli]
MLAVQVWPDASPFDTQSSRGKEASPFPKGGLVKCGKEAKLHVTEGRGREDREGDEAEGLFDRL